MEKNNKELVIKEYGIRKIVDSLSIELKPNEFDNWNELVDRTESIICNDSIPIIVIHNNNETKKIALSNMCYINFGCILIRERNVIELHNDSIFKFDEFIDTMEGLENTLRKEYENNGKSDRLCDNPKKLILFISYNENFDSLTKTLDKLTTTYEQIASDTNISIVLSNKIVVAPEPPIEPPPLLNEFNE